MGKVISEIKELPDKPAGFLFLKKPPEFLVGAGTENHADILDGRSRNRIVCGGIVLNNGEGIALINMGGSSLGMNFSGISLEKAKEYLRGLPDAKRFDI